MPRGRAATLTVVLLFPALHILTLSMLSDWVLWPWYFYSFVLSSLAGCALISVTQSVSRLQQKVLAPLALGLSFVYLLYVAGYSLRGPNSVNVYTSSAQLAAFMDSHPGIYAMGDQAATTAYLAKEPIIQLEGLVMDADYLHKIKSQEPLSKILADYHASYYVTFANAHSGACMTVHEPAQAGSSSPRSTGTICSQPLATFYRMSDPIEVFPAQAVQ